MDEKIISKNLVIILCQEHTMKSGSVSQSSSLSFFEDLVFAWDTPADAIAFQVDIIVKVIQIWIKGNPISQGNI